MTGRQECLRATAQSRRGEDRAYILVLPCSSALLHWPLPPLWVLDLRRASRSSDLLLSMCIDAPESITNSRSSGFVEEGAGITQASAHPLPSPMRLRERIAPDSGFRLAFFPRILESTEFAPEVHIFALLPAMDIFFSDFLRDAPWSSRTWLRGSITIFH